MRLRGRGTEFTNIAITFNSGQAGIAYWINSYLKLEDGHRMHEDHEAVRKIREWLNDQADAGRSGEVSDEEMLIQVQRRSPQYLP